MPSTGQGHITGARGHIHEQEIHVLPDHIGPELLDRTGNDRAAPHNGVFLVLHQQVDAHYINAHAALDGPAALVVRHGTAMNAEQLGDGRAGDVRVENGRFIAQLLHGDGQHRRDGRFADAAFAGDDRDDLFDI